MNVVFDMDGVIFDTETLCHRSWKSLEQEYGLKRLDETFAACIGSTHQKTAQTLKESQGEAFDAEGFLNRASAEIRRLIREEGIPVKPYAKELLVWLRQNHARVALASSTATAIASDELKMAGLYEYFDAVIGGDQAAKSKPEPDIYLHACKCLGVNPQESFGVEDSYNGVRSAAAAGMKVLMVPDRLAPTPEMEKLAYRILPDLGAVKELLEKQGSDAGKLT